MGKATIYFHNDLNIFLAEKPKDRCKTITIRGHETVKHIIESIGIPHTEVDVILVNGVSKGFSWQPVDGDIIEVYPEQNGWSTCEVMKLQPELIGKPRFVLDGHLGKLTGFLRLLGFDSKYQNEIMDDELVEISKNEGRIILTRDRGVLKRAIVKRGYLVRSTDPRVQIKELVNKFSLDKYAEPFSRCVNCNGILQAVPKRKVLDRLEPKTKSYYNDFKICSECKQIYWKGSHFDKIEIFIDKLLGEKRTYHETENFNS